MIALVRDGFLGYAEANVALSLFVDVEAHAALDPALVEGGRRPRPRPASGTKRREPGLVGAGDPLLPAGPREEPPCRLRTPFHATQPYRALKKLSEG